jgi:hypothetical protein
MKMLLFRAHTLSLVGVLLAASVIMAKPAVPDAKVPEQTKLDLRRFKHGTLREFLADTDRKASFASADVACVSHNSDLPEPFKGSRQGKEYYFLEPKAGKYKNIKFLVEVKGTHEIGEAAVSAQLPSSSPFWRALRTGRGADRFYILRTLVVEL